MALSFQTEDFDTFLKDGAHIFPVHFEELSLNKEKIPFGLDSEMYHNCEENRMLHILTARLDGEMIGYVLSLVVKHHPHNRDAGPYSTTDMFYVKKEHRNGTGVRLLMENERRLKEMGVRRMSISTKLKNAHIDLFSKLGFSPTDLVFHKVLA